MSERPSQSPPLSSAPEAGEASVLPLAETSYRRIHVAPPTEEDLQFIQVLREAGLLLELGARELGELIALLGSRTGTYRQLDLLELYYEASDADVSARRTAADRFFLFRAGEPATAHDVVRSLAKLTPELPEMRLERFGDSDGLLVLRAGEHFSAVVEEEDNDIADMDDTDPGHPPTAQRTLTVRSLVSAFNGLLHHEDVSRRFVPLCSDSVREAYVVTSLSEAATLFQGECLEVDTMDELTEFGSW